MNWYKVKWVEIARNHKAELLLAVGGGSACDYAKAVSVSVNCEKDSWEKYYLKFDEPSCDIVLMGCWCNREERWADCIRRSCSNGKLMKELGLIMNITELGATEDMLPELVKGTLIFTGEYKVLDTDKIEQIFRECF